MGAGVSRDGSAPDGSAPDGSAPPRTGRRVVAVDLLRGVAILDMVLIHFVQWQIPNLDHDAPLIAVGHFFGGLAAPLFLLLVGVSLVLSVSGRKARGIAAASIRRHIVRRGVAVLAVAYLLNAVEYQLYGFFSMQILHCIGFSILLAYALLRLPRSLRVAAVLAFIVLAPALRAAFGYPVPFYWTYPHEISGFGGYLEGVLATGYYPLFPWFAFVLVGTLVGDALVAYRPRVGGNARAALRRRFAPLIALAGIFIVVAAVAYGVGGAVDIFPATTVYVTVMAAVAVLFSLLMIKLLDVDDHPLLERGIQPLVALGKIALTVYVLHHFVGYNLAGVLGMLGAASAGQTVALVLAFLILMLVLAYVALRHHYRGTLEYYFRRL